MTAPLIPVLTFTTPATESCPVSVTDDEHGGLLAARAGVSIGGGFAGAFFAVRQRPGHCGPAGKIGELGEAGPDSEALVGYARHRVDRGAWIGGQVRSGSRQCEGLPASRPVGQFIDGYPDLAAIRALPDSAG